MSKKRKQPGDLSSPTVKLPQTFRDITQLPNSDLNYLLRQLNLPAKGKRTHKFTVLASHLGIQTTNTDEADPFRQTLADINAVVDGWSEDLRNVPEVKLDYILKYLLAAHDVNDCSKDDQETYNAGTLKSYKALQAYDLWESGHISGFKFNPLSEVQDVTALRCVANPSGDTSGTQYQVTVVLNNDGQPIGASCSCVAGIGEACTHIAGLLFGVEDFVSRGYKALPNDQASTEKLCKWIVPRGPKVEPKSIKKINVAKNIPGVNKKEKLFRASTYNPLPATESDVNVDDVELLHHTLSLQCSNLPWVRAIAPAFLKQHKNEVSTCKPPAPIENLPEIASFDSPLLVPAYEAIIETCEEPITIINKLKIKILGQHNNPLSYSAEERQQIEKLTTKQSNSVQWKHYRLGMITASNYSRVAGNLRTVLKNGPNKATETLCETLINGSQFKGNTATRYGQIQEPYAAAAYLKEMEKTHVSCHLAECGLFMSEDNIYLGASPDRIFTCDCHGQRLVEIKCPYTLSSPDKDRTKDYLTENEEKQISLKRTGNPYYDQVQGQMGVSGIKCCDFVVWNGQKVEVVDVQFDEMYWKALADSLSFFHREYVYPALICKLSAEVGKCSSVEVRKNVQAAVSQQTNKYPCGKCGKVLSENVTNDCDASVKCECPCKCQLWFHWKCVGYRPEPDLLDVEPPWCCPTCLRNCDDAL